MSPALEARKADAQKPPMQLLPYDALVAASEVAHGVDATAPAAPPPAEDVVGWLDTWAAENEIPLPPPPVD